MVCHLSTRVNFLPKYVVSFQQNKELIANSIAKLCQSKNPGIVVEITGLVMELHRRRGWKVKNRNGQNVVLFVSQKAMSVVASRGMYVCV